jgi:hypothetical protein
MVTVTVWSVAVEQEVWGEANRVRERGPVVWGMG